MSSTVTPAGSIVAVRPGGAGVAATYRVELAKLGEQLTMRVVLAVCGLAPIGFALVMRIQSSVPADTLFGRWATTSGFATSLTVLGFAGSLGLPFVAGVLSGDVFASEDRYGTWKTILTRSCTRGEIFAGKAAASATLAVVAVLLLSVSSLLAGVLLVGSDPLVGLSGQLLSGGRAFGLVLASWGFTLLPTLAFVALGLLLSVVTRSGIVAVLGPAVVGLLMQLLALLGPGEIVRALLISTPFDAWHGLLTSPHDLGPLVRGAATSVAYIVLFLGIAWHVLRRRGFAGSEAVSSHRRRTTVRVGVAIVACVALLVVASGWGPNRITAGRLQSAISPTFTHLVVLQYRWRLHRMPPAAPTVRTTCARSGRTGVSTGPGDDWACTVRILRPKVTGAEVPLEVTVRANGCYTAQGAPSIVGPLLIRDDRGKRFLNPLYAFDGCFSTS